MAQAEAEAEAATKLLAGTTHQLRLPLPPTEYIIIGPGRISYGCWLACVGFVWGW